MTTVSYSAPSSETCNELDEEIQNLLHLESLYLLSSSLTNSETGLDEGDVFQCGKCKKQFSTFSTFFSHKKEGCQELMLKKDIEDVDSAIETAITIPGGKADSIYETDEPVVVNESSQILPLSLKSEDFDVPTSQPNENVDQSVVVTDIRSFTLLKAGSLPPVDIPGPYLLSTEVKAEKHILIDENSTEMVTLSVLEDESRMESSDFANKASLKELEYRMKCSYCGKLFRKKFDLQQHLRSHTKERPFQCIVCGRAFSQKSNVMKHMTTHKVWPTKLLTLPKNPFEKNCDGSNSGDKVPSADVFVMENTFVCQYCPSVFKSFRELKSHRKTHSSQKVYKCIQKDCNTTFEDLDSFLEHIQSHKNEAQYKCHMCHSKFHSLHDLAVHQNCHDLSNKSSTKTLTCRKCKSKFSSFDSLEQHLATDSHRYPCSVCEKIFICERFLRRHLLTHTSTPNYFCPICHKAFRTEQYLNIHKTIHSSLKPFSCKLCPAKFNRKDKLSRHNLIHENAKRYKCPFNKLGCGKEFNRKDKLKEHILTHSCPTENICELRSDDKEGEMASREETKVCKLHGKLIEKQVSVDTSEDTYGGNMKLKNSRSGNVKDDVPTIEIVVMPMLGSSDQPGEATFGVVFPGDGPVDLSQTIGALPYHEVPIYTVKPLK